MRCIRNISFVKTMVNRPRQNGNSHGGHASCCVLCLLPAACCPLFCSSVARRRFPLRRGDDGTSTHKPTVAYVTNGIADFWVVAAKGAEAAARDANVELFVRMPPDGVGDQKRMVQELLTQGVDGIAISPIDPDNQADLLDEIAGIRFWSRKTPMRPRASVAATSAWIITWPGGCAAR